MILITDLDADFQESNDLFGRQVPAIILVDLVKLAKFAEPDISPSLTILSKRHQQTSGSKAPALELTASEALPR